MDQVRTDIRFAFRTLAKNPSFAVTAMLVLALGIGATTAIFSLVNAVLLRPLPYRDPARLVAFSTRVERTGRLFPTVTLNEVERWRGDSRGMESIGSFVFSASPVKVRSRSLFLVTVGADPEFLDTLGIQPAIGRNFPGSGSARKDSGVIISHHLWMDAFGGDAQVLGQGLVMDGAASTVIGVLPASFQFPRSDASFFPEDPEIIYPVANIAQSWGRGNRQWFAIGRLKKEVALGQAEAELRTIKSNMAGADPATRGLSVSLAPLNTATTGSVRTALLLTLGISIVLLLIACTNIMNLLFSRAAQRAREMAIRRAAGATPARLIRQMLTESVCLTFVAGALGVWLASMALTTLAGVSPAHLPIAGRLEIDRTVLAFAIAICAASAILAGFLPALHRSRLTDARSSGGRGVLRFQRTLMAGQIGLGVGLLAAGGLLTHSLMRLSAVNPGFRTKDAVGFELAFPSGDRSAALGVYQRVLEAAQGVPGVLSAGWITSLPPETRAGVFMGFTIPGSQPGPAPVANHQVISEDYFQAAGIALSRGRNFTAADGKTSPPVAIINETLARQYFPNTDPLGRHINDREIVGVIREIHDRGLNTKTVATIYLPYRQFQFAYGAVFAHIGAPADTVIAEIRRRVEAADPTIAIKSITTIDDRLRRTLDGPRFYTILSAGCALIAILFVTLGLYGVVSHAVASRTSEIGIRMALGAPQHAILRGVIVESLQVVAIGVVLGTAFSLASSRLLESLLFEIKPIDPATLSAAAGLVLLVTMLASFVPARRASRVDPLVALRHE